MAASRLCKKKKWKVAYIQQQQVHCIWAPKQMLQENGEMSELVKS